MQLADCIRLATYKNRVTIDQIKNHRQMTGQSLHQAKAELEDVVTQLEIFRSGEWRPVQTVTIFRDEVKEGDEEWS